MTNDSSVLSADPIPPPHASPHLGIDKQLSIVVDDDRETDLALVTDTETSLLPDDVPRGVEWITDVVHRMPSNANEVYYNGSIIHLIVNERNLKAFAADSDPDSAPAGKYHSLLPFLPAPVEYADTPCELAAQSLERIVSELEAEESVFPPWLLCLMICEVMGAVEQFSAAEMRAACDSLGGDCLAVLKGACDEFLSSHMNDSAGERSEWLPSLEIAIAECVEAAADATADVFVEALREVERTRELTALAARAAGDAKARVRLARLVADMDTFIRNDECLPVWTSPRQMRERSDAKQHRRPSDAPPPLISWDQVNDVAQAAVRRAGAWVVESRERLQREQDRRAREHRFQQIDQLPTRSHPAAAIS